jgi:UDP-glucose 4-epimerase
MKILITGGSSFTGYWFIRELAARRHAITAVVRGNKEQYTGLRKDRIDQVAQWADIVWNCSFGEEGFLQLLNKGYDAVCHHGAQVENYKSPDFDVAAALHSNTLHTRLVFEKLKAVGTRKFVITGTVFEANEGLGNPPLVAFSPYGLSKSFSWEVFRYWSWKLSIPVTKFVIPNPFGPYEEPRFCNFLIQTWKKGEIPAINTPDYIRDNIHADLLARYYALAVESRHHDHTGGSGSHGVAKDGNNPVTLIRRYGPSGYIESQGAFATRFATEMAKRLPLRCEIRLNRQTAFDEPLIRTNDAAMDGAMPDWNEQQAWDELANYYEHHILK